MRLPLRHPPPGCDPPLLRCAHLEALTEALVGVPLGPAAARVASWKSRGRHGNALQWHLGLEPHDSVAELDWENRIEIKLVSVWMRGVEGQRGIGCDKLKVCDVAVDPWRKLSNVLWVFADRLTRVVVAAALWRLHGEARRRLEGAWDVDPHFGEPDLFVEAREMQGKRAPAYYLAARWLAREGLLPAAREGRVPGVFGFDGRWFNETRAEHGRDPLATLVGTDAGDRVQCPRCGGPIRFDADRLRTSGWSPAHHAMPLRGDCAVRGHFCVDAARMVVSHSLTAEEFRAAVEGRVEPGQVWRLADRVTEPDDHLH